MPPRKTRSSSRRTLEEPQETKPGAQGAKRATSDNASGRGLRRAKATQVNGDTELDIEKQTKEAGSPVREFKSKKIDKVALSKVVDDGEGEEEEEEEEEVEVTVKQTKRKRTTKKDKEEEVEMEPLAVRTKGLRMFVGAHVSASKGVYRYQMRRDRYSIPLHGYKLTTWHYNRHT